MPTEWGDRCPDCGVAFPQLSGPHPTWIPCGLPTTPTPDLSDRGLARNRYTLENDAPTS